MQSHSLPIPHPSAVLGANQVDVLSTRKNSLVNGCLMTDTLLVSKRLKFEILL